MASSSRSIVLAHRQADLTLWLRCRFPSDGRFVRPSDRPSWASRQDRFCDHLLYAGRRSLPKNVGTEFYVSTVMTAPLIFDRRIIESPTS